jgi:branched-chain amino acid transport system ATP-binding protein
MLKLEKISTYYGQVQALRHISLEVAEGEIVAVIGPNGAGKTTLMNTISGIVNARDGEIIFCGQSIANLSPEKIVRLGIGHVPERRQVFGTMSVLDNLILGAYHRYRRSAKEEIDQDLEFVFEIFPRLKDRVHQAAGTLSGGEQQMLVLGRGWMAKPKLLLMDEPSLGLAPLLIREIFRVSARYDHLGGGTERPGCARAGRSRLCDGVWSSCYGGNGCRVGRGRPNADSLLGKKGEQRGVEPQI